MAPHQWQWPITDDLATLRERIQHHSVAAGLTGPRLDDLLIAANEAAINVLEHGGGRGTLTLRHDAGHVTVEVVDHSGRLTARDAHSTRPTAGAARGRGLWLMRQLCDEFTVHQDAGRSLVRLRVRLRPLVLPA